MFKKKVLITIVFFMSFFSFFGSAIILSQEIDRSKITLLRWVGPGRPGTYQEYIASIPEKPFLINEINVPEYYPIYPKLKLPKVLVIVETSIYSAIRTEIERYVEAVKGYGYDVKLFKSSGGTPENLKSFIKKKKKNLIGCVFVGWLPTAWYEVEDDFQQYGYAEFPCDLFFMDLDGKWEDSDSNGKYDSHSSGKGDCKPEIFIGRIDSKKMTGKENKILKKYFNKNNKYWSGKINLKEYGLTYTEDDWEKYYYFRHDISYLYDSSYQDIAAPDTNRNDYLNKRLKKNKYEFIQLACHSYPGGHSFTRGGWLLSNEVKKAPPKGLGFNLFCCSACRFTESDFLGGAYIFNKGKKALTVIGSAKTGSMLEFHYFYKSLGKNNPIGTAFKEWFEKIAPYDEWKVYWHYGMTIIGDPMISFLKKEAE